MKRTFYLLYGIFSYAIFFLMFLYAVGFIGNFLVPVTMDGEPKLPFFQALVINISLMFAFAIQHSVMARPAFKRWWYNYVPETVERSTYVLLSSAALFAMFLLWQPLGGTIWKIENPSLQALIYGVYALGWGIVFVSTFLINHFDLFGLRQVFLNFKNKPYEPLPFTTPGLYRFVRHPLYVGWITLFWATPHMTVTHALFASLVTLYIVIAIHWEEKDLAEFHPEYSEYKKEVPALIPRITKSKPIEVLAD